MKPIEFWRAKTAKTLLRKGRTEQLLASLRIQRRCRNLDTQVRVQLDADIAKHEGLTRKYERALSYYEERILELQSRFTKVLRA